MAYIHFGPVVETSYATYLFNTTYMADTKVQTLAYNLQFNVPVEYIVYNYHYLTDLHQVIIRYDFNPVQSLPLNALSLGFNEDINKHIEANIMQEKFKKATSLRNKAQARECLRQWN